MRNAAREKGAEPALHLSEVAMASSVVWCGSMMGRNPQTNMSTPVPTICPFAFGSISTYGSFIIKFICCWDRWRFLSALILPCASWDTRKSKRGSCWREEARRGKGLGKRYKEDDGSTSQLCCRAGPHRAGILPGSQHDLIWGDQPSPLNSVSSTCTSWHVSTKLHLLVPDLSLLFGSFSLCPYMGRVTWVTLLPYGTQISTF